MITIKIGPCKRWHQGQRCVGSLEAEKFFEIGFGEDSDAEFLGFVVFGAGVCADYHVVGFFAYGAGNFAAVLEDEFAGFFAGTVIEAAGEDKGFAGQSLAFDFALFGGGTNAGFVSS